MWSINLFRMIELISLIQFKTYKIYLCYGWFIHVVWMQMRQWASVDQMVGNHT